MREDYRNRHRNEPVFGMRIPYGDLPELEELAPDGSDSYLGILKGDVDGLGKCLAALKFAELARHDALRGQLPARMPPAAGAAYLFCDTLTRAGDYRLPPAGTRDAGFTSDVGALFYVHGSMDRAATAR